MTALFVPGPAQKSTTAHDMCRFGVRLWHVHSSSRLCPDKRLNLYIKATYHPLIGQRAVINLNKRNN